MSFFHKKIPWYKKKKITIPLGIFLLLLVARVAMVPIIHKQLNNYLATFSPSLYFHMDDLDLAIIRGAYRFEGITGKVKGQKNDFVSIKSVDVSLAWRDILKGQIVTDINVSGLDFSYTKELLEALAKAPEKDEKVRKERAKDAKKTLFPLKVERVDLTDSSITLDDYPSLEEGKKFQITKLEGRINNLIPEEELPLSSFNLSATILGNSVMKTSGHLNTLKKPLQWDIDGELHNFDLTTANAFMKRKIPLTFTKGKLDLYAEAESQEGKIEGYVKPFFKDLDVMKITENWKGPKHWFIEAVTAFGNLVLRNSDNHSVATKIPFKVDKEGLKTDTGEAVSKVIENGFKKKLRPGIENQYELK